MPVAGSRDTVVQVSWLQQLRARVNAMDPRRVDTAIAALLAIDIVAEGALVDAQGRRRALGMVIGVALVAPLAVRRPRPVAAARAFAAGVVVQATLGDSF